MKKILGVILIFSMLMPLSACRNKDEMTEESTEKMYVSTGSLYIYTQDVQSMEEVNQPASELMNTYIEILKSRAFNQMLSDEMEGKYTCQQIASMISFEQVEDTSIMSVTVTCSDEDDAYLICQSVIDLADDEIMRVFEGGRIKVVDEPEIPT